MSENPSPQSIPLPPFAADYKERRTGLLVFGILEIMLGFLCLLLVGFMVLGQVMISKTPGSQDVRMLFPVLLVYVGLAAVFVWLGIGSILCRRWARALILILAWVWLCVGVILVPMMAFLMPGMLANASANGQALPHGMLVAIVVFELLFIGLFMVLLPGVLVFFYSSRHVKATCETRDPVRRWTDACPLPVLGLACLLWLGSASMLAYPFAYHGVLPIFGTIISGLPGMLLAVVLAVVWFWLGRMCYQLKVAGWWAILAIMLLFSLSSFITFRHLDITELYQKMGFPEAQIDLIRRQGIISNKFLLWNTVAWLLPVLGYLIWVRRFFPPATQGGGRQG